MMCEKATWLPPAGKNSREIICAQAGNKENPVLPAANTKQSPGEKKATGLRSLTAVRRASVGGC